MIARHKVDIIKKLESIIPVISDILLIKLTGK